jgi:enoyl-[acyl-carrier protein] reductase I
MPNGETSDQPAPAQAKTAHAAPAQPATGTLMAGKRGLIMGVANGMSLAWGIAAALAAQGAQLGFTYQGEALGKRVKPLAESVGSSMVLPCDVTDDASIDATFAEVSAQWGKLDFLVHAIGYADKQYLRGRYVDTPRAAFLQAMDISCFSFTAVAQRAAWLMQPGGAMLTLTYLGAERVTPHYNVMGVAKAALEASVRYLATDLGVAGVRVNAISAGPIRTLAASGIGDFRYIMKWNQYNAPLRRNVTIEDVGGAALYLLSDLASGVTGEVHHVDCGYHIVGMKNPDAPDISTVTE